MSAVRSRIAAASAALCLAAPASAQTLGQGGGPQVSWVRVVLALLFCLALAVAAALALRYRFRGAVRIAPGADRRLRLVETLRLSHQTDLCLIEVDGRTFLFAATPQGGVFHPAPVAPADEQS
jgi:flagellar biogenesis protein FliO